jgi:allantoin racemase
MAPKTNNDGANGRIVVINPNSTKAVTAGIDSALEPLRFSDGPRFDCITIEEGPPGIATQRHVDDAVSHVCDVIARESNSADAFIIACFSDPGLLSAREVTAKPVFGIGASSFAQATLLGERFGVIAILEASTVRQRRAVRLMGFESRYAGSLAIGFGAEELEGDKVRDRMVEVGRALIETQGADVLIMGCAGMACFRTDIEAALGVPVIDPSTAAATQALAAVRLAR